MHKKQITTKEQRDHNIDTLWIHELNILYDEIYRIINKSYWVTSN